MLVVNKVALAEVLVWSVVDLNAQELTFLKLHLLVLVLADLKRGFRLKLMIILSS